MHSGGSQDVGMRMGKLGDQHQQEEAQEVKGKVQMEQQH
jgi:hypothetical protein